MYERYRGVSASRSATSASDTPRKALCAANRELPVAAATRGLENGEECRAEPNPVVYKSVTYSKIL